MATDPVTAALDIGGKLIDRWWPNASETERQRVEAFLAVYQAQADIVKTEAASGSWLASSWRPITMLVFVGLITARWFGWAAPDLSEAEYLKLWDIVQIGLGGYTVGRTVEKITPSIVGALKK